VCLVGVIAFSIFAKSSPHRDLRFEQWSEAAQKLGLQLQQAGFSTPLSLQGRMAGVYVRAEFYNDKNDQKEKVVITVNGGEQLPFELQPGLSLLGIVGGREIELGDEEIDRHFHITGKSAAVFASLSEHVRSELITMPGASLADGWLNTIIDGDPTAERLTARIERVVALANEMRLDQETLPSKLLATIEAETVSGVRRRQLEQLFKAVTDPQIRSRAAEIALASTDPQTKLLGALYTEGARGVEVLLKLARNQLVPDHLRAHALSRLPPGTLDALDVLALNDGAGPGLRAAIAGALRVQNEAIERALITFLKDEDKDVQLAAAASLAEVGTIASVEALLAAGEGLLKSSALKSATRGAVQAIQERAGDAGRGGLSLAEKQDERGALSVAASEAGALSIKSKD
jgi:hypothetical protein